jgi:hypothetical protein
MVTSALKMETVRFSETLVSTSQSMRRPNPEEHHKFTNSFTSFGERFDREIVCHFQKLYGSKEFEPYFINPLKPEAYINST